MTMFSPPHGLHTHIREAALRRGRGGTLVSHSKHDLVSYRNVQVSLDHDHSDEILKQSTMWPLEFVKICEHWDDCPFYSRMFAGRILAAAAFPSRAGRKDSRQAHCIPYGSVHPTGSSLLSFWNPTEKSHLTKEKSPSRWRKWGADLG